MLADYEVETDAQKMVLDAARAYVSDFPSHSKAGRGLVMLGAVGTGKTMLACAILQERIRAMSDHVFGLAYAYTTAAELNSRITATWRAGSQYTEQQVLDEFRTVRLLVIDDVGAQAGTAVEQANLQRVIDARYADQSATVLVSNLTLAELEAYLGARAMDRLKETSHVLVFEWASRRGTQ